MKGLPSLRKILPNQSQQIIIGQLKEGSRKAIHIFGHLWPVSCNGRIRETETTPMFDKTAC